jgi:hypothetical protein
MLCPADSKAMNVLLREPFGESVWSAKKWLSCVWRVE